PVSVLAACQNRTSPTVLHNRSVCLAALHSFATSKVKQFENLATQLQELRIAAMTWPARMDENDLIDPPGAGSHDDDPIAHVNRFIDIVSNKQSRASTC